MPIALRNLGPLPQPGEARNGSIPEITAAQQQWPLNPELKTSTSPHALLHHRVVAGGSFQPRGDIRCHAANAGDGFCTCGNHYCRSLQSASANAQGEQPDHIHLPLESPGSEDRAGHRKHIDVPVERFAAAHMTRNAASQPTRALGRAAVQISTGSERRARVPNPRHHRLTQIDQQDVSAARCGDVLSARPEFCCSAGSHAVMRTGVAAAALKIGVSARRPRGCRHARACRDPGCRD